MARACFHLGIHLVSLSHRQEAGTEKENLEFGLDGGAFLGWLRKAQKKIHLGVFSPALSLPPRSVYDDLVTKGVIVPAQEVPPPTVPMDYSWARVGAMCVLTVWAREIWG